MQLATGHGAGRLPHDTHSLLSCTSTASAGALRRCGGSHHVPARPEPTCLQSAATCQASAEQEPQAGPPTACKHLPPSTRVYSSHRLWLWEEIQTHAGNRQLHAANGANPRAFPTRTKGGLTGSGVSTLQVGTEMARGEGACVRVQAHACAGGYTTTLLGPPQYEQQSCWPWRTSSPAGPQ